MANATIGILTGGGDVPGLNAVIKTLTHRATENRAFKILGIRRGWEGLTHADLRRGLDSEYVMPLDRAKTRTVDRTGGTFLHTSRTNPAKLPIVGLPPHVRRRAGRLHEVAPGRVDATPIVLDNLQKLGIDYLVAIGGDDTLSYAAKLHGAGFPVVAVPKTMDNDVRNTEYCIGFSTAMTRAVSAINDLRTTLGSHERTGIVRIFGRDAGFTALYAAYVTSVRCCIPEARFELQHAVDLLLEDKRNNPSRYAILLLSEGAAWRGMHQRRRVAKGQDRKQDQYGHEHKGNVAEGFAAHFEKRTGEESTVEDLTYELRSGAPDFLDKMVANTFATMAFQCILDGNIGRMMAVQNGCYTDADIPDPSLGPRMVDVEAMYDRWRLRPDYSSKAGLPVFMMRA